MLRPFKSFLNNLQKNAIGATIFGILPDMTNNPETEEDEEEIVNENMYNSDVVDPLSDPLAIDDVIINQTEENGSEFASGNTTLTELDSSDDGQIILVDVNSLKNAFPTALPVSSYESCGSTLAYGISANNNSISSSAKESSNVRDDKNNCSVEQGSFGTSLPLNIASDDGIGVTFEPIVLALEDDEINDEIEGVRSDGSDSGLGLELSAGLVLDKANVSTTAVVEASIAEVATPVVEALPNVRTPRSNLKRRSDPSDHSDAVETKKPKRNIQFSGVTVYYFPRIQGFTCIPSQGGCTLGMGPHHYDQKSYSLSEHMSEQKRIHRQQMLEGHKIRSPLPAMATAVTATTANIESTNTVSDDHSRSSTEESEESEEEVLSDNSSSELDTETNGFLQPVSQRQRRALLKAAGVREIQSFEKNECRDIRASREFCGCQCRGDYCDPETCFCSQSGIKCQVDRAGFPCVCTENGCANRFGRVEFNPKRVRTHFIHTLMRLELEKKQEKSEKQTALNAYDGRLRLRDNDDDHQLHSQQQHHTGLGLGQLVNYNPSNSIIYPASMSTATSSIGDMVTMVDSHMHCNNNSDFGSATSTPHRNSANGMMSMPESPLDLHYAFRNDYQVDISTAQDQSTPSFTLYSNPSYFSSASGSVNFTDYSSLSSTTQPNEIAPNYLDYSTNLSYSGLMSNDAAINNVAESCAPFIETYTHDTSGVNINSALFDGSQDDDISALRINSIPLEKNSTDLDTLLRDDGERRIAPVDGDLNKPQTNSNVGDSNILLEFNEAYDKEVAALPSSVVQSENDFVFSNTTADEFVSDKY